MNISRSACSGILFLSRSSERLGFYATELLRHPMRFRYYNGPQERNRGIDVTCGYFLVCNYGVESSNTAARGGHDRRYRRIPDKRLEAT